MEFSEQHERKLDEAEIRAQEQEQEQEQYRDEYFYGDRQGEWGL